MLARLYDFTLRLFLGYAACEWTARLCSQFCHELRFNWTHSECVEPALIVLAMSILLWAKQKRPFNEPIAQFTYSTASVPGARPRLSPWDFPRSIILLYSILNLFLFAALGAECGFNSVLKVTACCLETAHQYEAAERVYQKVTKKGRFSSLARWQTTCKLEDPSKLLPRNDAVARVYGDHSNEMADRFRGVAYSSNHDGTDFSYVVPYGWFEKAEEIYEENHVKGKAIDCLGQMANIKECQNDLPASKELIKRAGTLTDGAIAEIDDFSFDFLGFSAGQRGLNNEVVAFDKIYTERKKRENAKSLEYENMEKEVIPFSVLFAILASGLGQIAMSEYVLNRRNKKLLNQLGNSSSKDMQIALLDQSITIDLAQKNVESAVFKSEYLLQLASGDAHTALPISENFDWLAKRRRIVLGRECYSFAVASVILYALFA